ncbi:MAG: DUF1461 domain-containing protein [Clostridia bacterium]|nr:DUF1461 domain-containing protein [Clostridia bacterium]
MKKLSSITNVLACLMVVLAAMGAVCGAVNSLATDVDFYGVMSRQAVMDTLGAPDEPTVSAYIGLSEMEQHAFAQDIAAFMAGETDVLPVDVLNEKEQQHMLDVRGLVLLAKNVSQACMTIAAALAVVIAWTGARDQRRGLPFGAIAGLAIVAAIAGGVYVMLGTSGFERLFVGMHELLFTNDLWMLDPHTDILIRMMPQLLFERAGIELVRLALSSGVITWALLGTVYFMVGNMIRRNLTEREKQ